MFRRLAALVAIAAAALFVSAGSASADYTTDTAPGTTSSSTVGEDGTVVFAYTGGEYAPGAPLTFSVTYNSRVGGGPGSMGLALAPRTAVVGSGHADAQGNFSTTIKLTEPGLATLSARGLDRDGGTLVVTATVRVLASGSAAGGAAGLPRTGSDLSTQLWVAGGLLAAGGSLVILSVSRRRRAEA